MRAMSHPVATLLKLLFSGVLILALLATSNIVGVIDTVVNTEYSYFIISLVVSFIAMFVATLRWKILLSRFDSEIGFLHLFRLTCLSYFYNFFIPGGVAGDFIRGYQCQQDQVTGSQGVASVVVDRIIGLGSFMVLGIIGLFCSLDTLRQPLMLGLLSAGSICLVICGCVYHNRKKFDDCIVIKKIHQAVGQKIRQFLESVYGYKAYGRIAFQAMTVSLITALINVLSFYLLSKAVGSHVELIYFIIFIPCITVASYLPISYSGLGIRELCFVLLFGQAGMTRDQALAIPVMYFCMLLVLSLVGGVIFLIFSRPAALHRVEPN